MKKNKVRIAGILSVVLLFEFNYYDSSWENTSMNYTDTF